MCVSKREREREKKEDVSLSNLVLSGSFITLKLKANSFKNINCQSFLLVLTKQKKSFLQNTWDTENFSLGMILSVKK